MRRRLGLLLAMALLGAAMLPSSVAAAGGGRINRGGSPTANVTVTCLYNAGDNTYDVLATVNPDLLVQIPDFPYAADALLWGRASAKASAPAVYLDAATYFEFPFNYVTAYDVWGPPFYLAYMTVQIGYFDEQTWTFVVVGSGTGKCQRGDAGSAI